MCLYKQGIMSVTSNKETFEFDLYISFYNLSVPLRSLSRDKLLVPVRNFITL